VRAFFHDAHPAFGDGPAGRSTRQGGVVHEPLFEATGQGVEVHRRTPTHRSPPRQVRVVSQRLVLRDSGRPSGGRAMRVTTC
jgi:hypothetical protein